MGCRIWQSFFLYRNKIHFLIFHNNSKLSGGFYMVYVESFILVICSILDIKYRKVPIFLSFIIPVFLATISYILHPNKEFLVRCIIAAVMLLICILFLITTNIGGADCLIMIVMSLYLGIYAIYAILIAVIVSIPYQIFIIKTHKNREYPFVPFLTIGYIFLLLYVYCFH